MAGYRIKNKTSNYTKSDNTHAYDKRLSGLARAIFDFMLRNVDDYHYSLNGLKYCFPKDSESSIKKALKELEECGYLERKRISDGKTFGWEYTWYEGGKEKALSQTEKTPEKKQQDTETAENLISENLTLENEGGNTVKDTKKKEKGKDPVPAAAYEEIVEYLNEQCGKAYKVSDNTKKHIRPRWEEGYRTEDFKKVIRIKAAQWKDSAKMSPYLRPSTLFAKSHFEDYLNENDPGEFYDAYGHCTDNILA